MTSASDNAELGDEESSAMTNVSSQPSALEEIRRGIVNVAVPHNEPPGVVRSRRIVVAIVLLVAGAGGRVGGGGFRVRAAAPRWCPRAGPQSAAGGQRHCDRAVARRPL